MCSSKTKINTVFILFLKIVIHLVNNLVLKMQCILKHVDIFSSPEIVIDHNKQIVCQRGDLPHGYAFRRTTS